MEQNTKPKHDGDITEYFVYETKPFFNPKKYVIYINGMNNSPKNHFDDARLLSRLSMCKVIGVFNKSFLHKEQSLYDRAQGFFMDLIQCADDKLNLIKGTDHLSEWPKKVLQDAAGKVKYEQLAEADKARYTREKAEHDKHGYYTRADGTKSNEGASSKSKTAKAPVEDDEPVKKKQSAKAQAKAKAKEKELALASGSGSGDE